MSNVRLTTAGAIALKHSMPTPETKEKFDIYTPLDKGGVAKVVTNLLSFGGEQAVDHINNLGKTFFNKATEIGASTPLSDYINESDERTALISEYSSKIDKVLHGSLSKVEKNAKLGEVTSEYNGKIAKQNLEYLLSKGSMAAKMAKTGARGNPSQLASGTSTPLMSINVKGDLIPIVIERSFAQGMRPAEHIALSYMGRGSTVLSQLSTSLPGALFKKLSPTVFHEVITEADCGTSNGILVDLTDTKSLLGRFTSDTNQQINESVLSALRLSNNPKVKVRSSLTCMAKNGVCQHCYGLWANGKLPEIGTNVGVVAAQSVSEVLTQAMLSTKHKATVGERKGNAYEQAANLMNNPAENFKDEATIASVNGKVNAVQKTLLGDHNVFIDGKSHFVPISQQVLVEPGQQIRVGDRLSSGTINPRKLVNLRGIGAGREYMAKELRDIYGGGLDPRHFEMIAKNLIKYVEVEDPGHTSLLTGEKLDINHILPFLDHGIISVPTSKSKGKVLAKGILNLTAGTYLDDNHVEDLIKAGVGSVEVTGSGLKVTPIVPGLQTAKMLDPDWISRLSFSRLRDTLKESASVGATSNIHSTDPIPSYVIGREFGEGPNGAY